MKKVLHFIILMKFVVALGACSPDSHEQPARIAPTAKVSGPTISEEHGYKIARGATRLPDVTVRFDAATKTMRLSGQLEYLSVKDQVVRQVPLDLVGVLDKNGFIALKTHLQEKASGGDLKLVAKATCLSEAGDCSSSFIDIYLHAEGLVYHHQIESHQDEVAPKEVVKESEEEVSEGGGDEVEGEPGQYVGTLKEDIETLLEVKPSKPQPPASSSVSQAIGPVNAGRLENATNVLNYQKAHAPTGFNIIRPHRLTHFSTSELAYIVAQMGLFTQKEMPGSVLSVGDLSREKGGRLGSHLSHQNGLDVDVAFYFNNKSFQGYFASAVAVDKPHGNWLPEIQWKLFKKVVSTHLIDRIFIHKTLKKALCQVAIQNGEIQKSDKEGLAYETLRRLIADTTHDNHFHLRVKCSSAQVRCRQMAEPAQGTGCF